MADIVTMYYTEHSELTMVKDPVTRTSSFVLSCLHAYQPTLEEIVDIDLHFSWVVRVSNFDRRCGCTHLLVHGSRYAACQVFARLYSSTDVTCAVVWGRMQARRGCNRYRADPRRSNYWVDLQADERAEDRRALR